MTPRDVILASIRFRETPYVPWHVTFTIPQMERLAAHYGSQDILSHTRNHVVTFRPPTRRFQEVSPGVFLDAYGTTWDRTADKDIGSPVKYALPEPTLKGFRFPTVAGTEEAVRESLAKYPGMARLVSIGFSLFERAWGLRGIENLLMDFIERPRFVHELLDAICEHSLEAVDWSLQFDPDIIHFGDDWGQQHGLIMGPKLWREFIRPRAARLYRRAHEAGKIVSIHTCGDVDELFDDLVEMGVNLFNPFQPEAMDIYALKRQYRGRLAFHGGMSIQRTLPFGTPETVRAETKRLLTELGAGGGYVFAPSHAVPADVPLENILTFLDVLHSQPGFVAVSGKKQQLA